MNVVQPVRVLDGEPRVLVLKLSERVENVNQHLGPLNMIVGIMDGQHRFLNQLAQPNQSLTIISILGELNAPEYINFDRINFEPFHTIEENINVLYTKLNEFMKLEKDRQGQTQTSLTSVNDDTLKWILFICSKTFFRNMRHWQNRLLQDPQGPNAEFYQREWYQRVDLQEQAITQLEQSL